MPRVSATSWSCVAPMYLRQSPADETNRRRQPKGVCVLQQPHTNSSVGSSSVVKMVWSCVQGSDAATHVRRPGCQGERAIERPRHSQFKTLNETDHTS